MAGTKSRCSELHALKVNAYGLKPLGLAWKRTSLPCLERSASRLNMPCGWVLWLLDDEGASQKGAPFFRGASRSISKGEGTE